MRRNSDERTHFDRRANRNPLFFLSIVPLLVALPALQERRVYAWGQEGHTWVSQKAIECLEGKLRKLFLEQRGLIVARSMAPDYRKDEDPQERFRHYIDLDRYGAFPFTRLNLEYEGLVKQFGEKRVQKNGTLLWTVEKTFQNLINAFRDRNQEEILQLSSDLAHYVADLHQPLHTVKNHDGQLSGQHGIHFRFETDLLNLYLLEIRFRPARPTDLGPVLDACYAMAKESYVWVDNILLADQRVVSALGIDRPRFSPTGKRKLYPLPYYSAMFQEVGPIVERQLNRAAQALASLWSMAYQRGESQPFESKSSKFQFDSSCRLGEAGQSFHQREK